ncbi:MAG TPA: hypothetical protein VHN39_01590 [Phenylobacterium sp.]|jgi:hypothetical protein|nr:hypothetical protein [Phenylobacterium sp.]
MTTVNYPNPVTVNGYQCKNCTDVDYAKKNIDPAHPADGPFGVDAKSAPKGSTGKTTDIPAVTLGGVFSGISPPANSNAPLTATQGQRLDVSV